MKRSPIRPRRREPRQRTAPRWTASEWAQADAVLQARARGRCECCGVPLQGRAERHHRQRRRDGGDRLANLLLVLPECHRRITDRERRQAVDLGHVVEAVGVRDPARVPVRHGVHGWCLLADDGRVVPLHALDHIDLP